MGLKKSYARINFNHIRNFGNVEKENSFILNRLLTQLKRCNIKLLSSINYDNCKNEQIKKIENENYAVLKEIIKSLNAINSKIE